MMRDAMAAMLLAVMLLGSGCTNAGAGATAREESSGNGKAMVALSAAEREEATLAATRFVEKADRGLYRELWLGMLQPEREPGEYRDFESLLVSREKAIGAIDFRRVASSEVVDAGTLGFGHGRFAMVVFCTKSEGAMFIDAVVLKRKMERDWIPATYRFKTAASITPDAERQAAGVFGPCEHFMAAGTDA